MNNQSILPEQNLEQPVIPPPPKINSLYIFGGLFIMTIILIGGIFIGQYLNSSQKIPEKEIILTPTLYPSPTITSITDPTANWKTYINNQFIFRFSYPPSWKVEETGKESLKLYPPRQSEVIDKIALFELRISIFSKVSLQQSDAEPTRNVVLPYEKILEQKTINGLPVTVSEFTTEKGYKNLVASIIFPEIEIRIITYPISSSHEDIFNQILSTFKFLE